MPAASTSTPQSASSLSASSASDPRHHRGVVQGRLANPGSMKDELFALEARKAELAAAVAHAPPAGAASSPEPRQDLPPEGRAPARGAADDRHAAMQAAGPDPQSLIDEIRAGAGRTRGQTSVSNCTAHWPASWRWPQKQKRRSSTSGLAQVHKLVAGGGFEPPTFRL